MTVRLYRSTDVGAPQLSTTNDGSMLSILRACLVEGYGSGAETRTPVGWTMPFSDLPNKKAVFQSVNGECIRIDDSIDYRWASAVGFKSMTSLDIGVEQYPSGDQIGSGYHSRVYKRYNTSAISGGWFVVAGDDFFYFINIYNSSSPTYPAGFFFGKYECINPSFTENYLLTQNIPLITDTSATNSYKSFYSSGTRIARRNYQNSEGSPTYLEYKFDNSNYVNPNPFTGSLELEKVRLTGGSPYVEYGSMIGMYRIKGSDNKGYRGGETFTDGTYNYIVAAYTSDAYAIRYDVASG